MRTRLPPAVLLLALAPLGACSPSADRLQTYWGPLDDTAGGTPYLAGASLPVAVLASHPTQDSTGGQQIVELAVVWSETEVTCDAYSAWLGEVAELQAFVDGVLAAPEGDRPSDEDWQGYVCQELGGASRDLFGGEGSYRALHALLDVTTGGPDGGLFRAATAGDAGAENQGAELLTSSRYVSRFYERSRHGEEILPEGSDGAWSRGDLSPVEDCAGILSALYAERLEGRTTYPDRAALVLQAATHRWYHLHPGRDDVQLSGDTPLPVGITFPGWNDGSGGAAVTSFQSGSRVPETFPYREVLLTTSGRQIPVAPCQPLADHAAMVWPESPALVPAAGGDDDDSAAP